MNQPIVRTLRLRCSIERAFEVFARRTDAWWPRSHRRWKDSVLIIEANVGGRVLERMPSGEESELGQVLRWEPPHRLSYTWIPGAVVGPTVVDVRFQTDGEATLMEIVHAPGDHPPEPDWPVRSQRFASAWDDLLPTLERYLKEKESRE